MIYFFFFFFNDTATTEIYTLSLHDALPISNAYHSARIVVNGALVEYWIDERQVLGCDLASEELAQRIARSEEHTSELQSQSNLVCRLLLEKKKNQARPLACEREFSSTARSA